MAAQVRHLDETCELLLASMAWPPIYAGPAPARSGTLQAGSTSTTAKLDTGASADDGAYKGYRIAITGGTGAGQVRVANAYNGATKVVTVDAVWSVTPDGTSTFTVVDSRRFAVQNVGDREMQNVSVSAGQVGTNLGYTLARIGADVIAIIPPYQVAVALGVTADGGTWGATGTYGYRITALNGTGETVGSVEVTIDVDDTTKRVTLTWTAVPGATGYNVYRTATPGTYGATSKRAFLGSGLTVSYVDSGGALSAGTVPAANLSGGAAPLYGTPPSFAATPLAAGNLKPGQMFIFWVDWVIPSGQVETDAQFLIRVREG